MFCPKSLYVLFPCAAFDGVISLRKLQLLEIDDSARLFFAESVIKLFIISTFFRRGFFQKVWSNYLFKHNLEGDYLFPGCPQIFFIPAFQRTKLFIPKKNPGPPAILVVAPLQYHQVFDAFHKDFVTRIIKYSCCYQVTDSTWRAISINRIVANKTAIKAMK